MRARKSMRLIFAAAVLVGAVSGGAGAFAGVGQNDYHRPGKGCGSDRFARNADVVQGELVSTSSTPGTDPTFEPDNPDPGSIDCK